MSWYGNLYRGNSTNNGSGLKTDEWRKTSYASDHVWRPVIIDAEGRKQPSISFSPNHNIVSYVTKAEEIVEHVRLPLVTEHIVSSTTKDHGVLEDKWRRPSSPVQDRQQKVEDFITKVQTEASIPNRFNPSSVAQWHPIPNSTGYHNNNNYDGYNDRNNQRNKPSGQNDNYSDYYRKNNSQMEPSMITDGGWARPSRSTWSAQPNGLLSNPTNDIVTAIEMLKEFSNPSAGTTTSRFSVPVSSGPRRDVYSDSDIVDSREAARRYRNPSSAARTVENYSTTIDSREAMRKYGGTTV
ncbi:LOW QUALITY PROTEIN: hypothetical protein CFOL_v3_07739 [Cephalotus follicularis]|uniref:Uncharacterized protein n=1 Tax=Cephalotus follicularis TaxID=3775 RepID=A0A1Q3B851_CEPFO|nr:LOW QUALITY PROTEIN: hypothetical protein CFOL_v3_07739 [Cephalotus follicularis]